MSPLSSPDGAYSFPNTHWSILRDAAGGPEEERRRAAMNALAEGYWKPVCAYIRSRWAKDKEEAQDLTQEFFLWMMESGFVGRADPTRGRFRAYLKVALSNYVLMEFRKERRQKRGGGKKQLSLNRTDVDWEPPAPEGRTPDQIMDAVWAEEVLRRAAALLETELKEAEKAVYFTVFREYCLNRPEGSDYSDVAARHGISVDDVRNYLKESRERFRRILRDLISETVSDPEELRDEIRALFGEGAL